MNLKTKPLKNETVFLKLACSVELDETTTTIAQMFDHPFDGQTISEITFPKNLPTRDGTWNLGAIVGSSGSGKSSLLKEKFGGTGPFVWERNRSIASQVSHEKLSAAGLNSVPSWCKPRHVLSTGEGFRADLATCIKDNASIDEFTSVVDRNVAQSCANGFQKYVRKNGLAGIVVASCHFDILEWLQPDWTFNLDTGTLSVGRLPRRPQTLDVHQINGRTAWPLFRNHHYLSAEMNFASRCYGAFWKNQLVGMSASLAYPSGTVKNAWREHRLVVLSDFQGFGIGVRLSDFVAELFVNAGCRYFSKTAHPVLGKYREKNPCWRGTSKNKKPRKDYKGDTHKEAKNYEDHRNRVCYCHEFVGVA